MRLFLVFAAFLFICPAVLQAQDSADDADPILDLLQQLEQEREKSGPSAEPLEPRLKDTLLNQGKKKLPYKNYSDIPEEAIIEAEAFEKACAANINLSTYYDCECWSMRFLETRLELGPLTQPEVVMMRIGAECPNTPAIAGSGYDSCIAQGIDFFPKKQDPEEYCSCVGNAYAKLFERSGQAIDTQLMVQLRTISSLSCIEQPPGVPPLVPPIK